MTQNVNTMKRVLTAPALVAFGLAYMVPLGIFTTYRPVTELSFGHLPIAYIITLATMFFTALSYCYMTRALPLAGSAYSYVQHSFGSNVGFLVGWVQILDYLFLPILNYIVIGAYLHEVFPTISSATFILIFIIVVSLLNVIGVKVISSVNFSLIALQGIFICLFIILAVSGATFSTEALLKPLLFAQSEVSGLISGAAILCLAFLGFDAIATLAEESNDAKRTVPKAIMWTVIFAGIIFLLVSYFAHLAYPNWQDFIGIEDAQANALVIKEVGSHFAVYADWFGISKEAAGQMQEMGSHFMWSFFVALYLMGVTASAMTSKASVSRIFFAMGRDGVLPKQFAKIHKRFSTPYISVLFASFMSLFALVIPLNLVISMISFGAIGAFTCVNLSVIKYFLVDKNYGNSKRPLLKYGVFPCCGLLLCMWLWTSLGFLTIKVGLLWLLVGFLYLIYFTKGFRYAAPQIEERELEDIIDIKLP